MAVASSSAQVAARLGKAGGAIRNAQAKAVRNASAALEKSVRSTSPGRLRGVGKNGAALGLSVKVVGGANPTATGKATGPWQLIEYNTSKHLITSKSAGGSRRRRTRGAGGDVSRLVSFGGSRVRVGSTVGDGTFAGLNTAIKINGKWKAGARHPGTRGKLVFHKGVAKGHPNAVAELHKTTVLAVKEALA